MLQQINLTRDRAGAGGNVHYNMTALVRSVDALSAKLASGPYAGPALVPASPWLSSTTPTTPVVSMSRGARAITLRISPPAGAASAATPRWWLVRSRYADGWHAEVVDAMSPTVSIASGAGGLPDFLVVTAIDRVGVESAPVRLLTGP